MWNLLLYLLPIALAYFTGTWVEKSHYVSINRREKEFLNLPSVSSRKMEDFDVIEESEMVTGNVVISLDYFKRFLAGLRNFFGGRIAAYETLLDRGRREAILRMKLQAQEKGYSMVINTRFETSSIGQATAQKGSVGCFEVLAYGTAIRTK